MSYFRGYGQLGTTDPQFFSSSSILANVNAPQPPPPSAGKAAESTWLKNLEKFGPMVLAAGQLILELRRKGQAPPQYVDQKSWAEKNLGLLLLGGMGLLAAVMLLKR